MKKALVRVPGFKRVVVNYLKKEAVVTYDPARTNPEELARTLAKETAFTVAVKPERERR